MDLTVLGCWAPYPRAGGACSGYLVPEGDIKLLLDCGNGVFSKLQSVTDFRTLSAVILTHFHSDHYLDIYCLRHAISGSLKDGSRKDKLKVFLPTEPKEVRAALDKYQDVFELIDINNLPLYSTKIVDLTVIFMPTKHPLMTFAVKVQLGSKHLIYTSDTQWDNRLIDFAADTELLLCEASLQEKDKEDARVGHLTCAEAGLLAKDAGAKKLILTHLFPESDLSISLDEARGSWPEGEIELAQEGRVYGL
jgi:ribonuclease BN (tRNA processing enzyme)